MVTSTEVPRRNNASILDTLVMRGGALVMHMVSSQTSVTDFPQGAVILVVVWGLLIALKAVGEWGRGLRTFALLSRKELKVLSFDSTTLKTVMSYSWGPLFWLVNWSLSSMNAGYETSRRGRGALFHQVILDPRPSSSMHQVAVLLYNITSGEPYKHS